MARTSRAASPAPEEPEVLEEPMAPILPETEPQVKPEPEPEPEAMEGALAPGDIMGIPLEPPTPEEHEERLGEAAGTFVDAGHILGTVAPRVGWPAMPEEAPEPPPAPAVSPVTPVAAPELELVMKPVEG
jgi:hypothetical protein